ncbi:serine hydrolase domain-containing protein [Massilia yuzhufengensis]|uniref:CubicO group peptidase, beta-lactamase class C family n=1 Tax=Massilia yuzhufengensis TaxID=1164594 RepID=A0A1I1UES7_9BURK|nr:serine hydrolase domain-containing protein [Massilia yuzhufengensis]SFD69194.1 CubicO group peptidase, beta-lactamase class C family [Massilia yuzhufengensis]
MRFRLSLLAPAALALSLLPGCAVVAKLSTEPLIEQHAPKDYSGVVGVRADARSTLVLRASGLALREEAQANTRDTRFMIGSMSKWITAVTVLRLADMGKLDLDAPIARHLPELPAANGAVTLRQLMSNRSGIPNGLSEALKKDKAIENLEIGPVAAALRFGAGTATAPGERWDYSVTNWVLVAAVVERATREPFTETVEELVLAPAGVRDTSFGATGYEDAVGMAVAYTASGARKVPAAPPMVAASGTMYSTARDLVAIADSVYFTKLLSDKARRELATVQVASEDYALGARVKTVTTKKGARHLLWSTGAFGGYKSVLAYDPADGRAVVLLNNTDMPQPEQGKVATALFQSLD